MPVAWQMFSKPPKSPMADSPPWRTQIGRAFKIKPNTKEVNPHRTQHHSCAELFPQGCASRPKSHAGPCASISYPLDLHDFLLGIFLMSLRSVPESLEDACSQGGRALWPVLGTENLGMAFSSWEPRPSCAMPLENSASSKKVGLKRKQRNILQGIQL